MFENLYEDLLKEVNTGNKCVMVTHLNLHNNISGSIKNKTILTKDDINKKSIPLNDEVYISADNALSSGKIDTVNINENEFVLIEPFFPRPRLIIFGGGHIAKPLVEFTSKIGFSVTVIDDRPYFANSTRFPDADKVLCEDFKKSFNLIDFKETDFVVIVTRGHRHDGLVLREALNYDLSYIGMIGSKRRVSGMMKELISENYSKEILDKVNSPIGIDINAVTPEEIAISITAQLISYKNKGTIKSKEFSYPEFDKEVALEISKKTSIPRAILTILSSKGSVPRKSGAKMISYFDGRSIGSIGGGCSEAEVINKARNVMMSNNKFLIEKVDMTGDIAESLGMVCGGVMDVLIEVL